MRHGQQSHVIVADRKHSWYLLYHTPMQVIAGYVVGLLAGAAYFCITDYVPMTFATSFFARIRAGIEWLWEGMGGLGGWELGSAEGGWGEGWMFLDPDPKEPHILVEANQA